MRIVHLFSGGLDSSVALAKWIREGHEVLPLSINYGQRHAKELESAKQICRYYGLEFRELDLSCLKSILTTNSQTGSAEVPDGHYAEESMKLTVVPNRNMTMLSFAIAWAIDRKFDAVSFAAHGGDHTIYPDCRPEFIDAVHRCAQLCDWHPVDVLAPFAKMTKSEIVSLGAQMDLPFQLTWSCYKGLDKHCGKCGTCVERKEAFEQASLPDPTEYL